MSYEKEPATGNKESREIVSETSLSVSASNINLTAGKDLPIADLLDENLDEATPDDVILARPEWGSVAMAAMAGSFDMVVPAAMLAANYTLFRNADLRGEGSLTDGTMTLEATFQNMFQGLDENGKPKEDEDSLFDDFADMARDERAERKREMEEASRAWAEQSHTIAGQTMTADEWHAMRDWFADDKNRKVWEDAMMAQTGQSREEVKRTGGKMRRLYELTEKQSRGEKLTSEETTDFKTLSNDTDVKQGVAVEKTRMAENVAPSSKAETTGAIAETAAASVEAGNDLVAARANLNAEPITPTFNPVAKGISAPEPETAPAIPAPRQEVAMATGLMRQDML